jgi:hypothetical protein
MMDPRIKYVLMIICQTTFETQLFQNPNIDPNILYSNLLKKFFNMKEKENNSYLFNKNILFKNLSQITYAIAYYKNLTNFLTK